ncbi:ankyrin repeat-containing protein, putative [Talaromyces stipitatus ATCC 10500]|uniref:Ankyrin repeat-containing protein, putative n=1 Tax=Talaromyces stipitatus (strain ATCC 10500 / CBS 375.48 / QM 6759 / NRRL 1006) TaxID=441959 RepID=B8MI82_TALSN|nr:ankyrin repeat-containing protein, putative [Talaromyces stipitatus ATCC 10500]EED14566.1 ankyrin repeat-containing protein, putative [Talaromyces stipitatus ATCC 10500]
MLPTLLIVVLLHLFRLSEGGPTFLEEYRGSYVPKTIETWYGLQVIAPDTPYVARAGPNELYFIDTRFDNETASHVKEQIEKAMLPKADGYYFSIDGTSATVEIKNSETNETTFVFDPPYARVIFAQAINKRNPELKLPEHEPAGDWLVTYDHQMAFVPGATSGATTTVGQELPMLLAGRPESVDLLLDAGADPNLPGQYGYTPLRTCADFEVEQSRWRRIVQNGSAKAKIAGSIFLRDHHQPLSADDLDGSKWRSHSLTQESDSTHLDSILNSLVLHGAKISGIESSLREAFDAAVLHRRDYTAECLLRLQSRFLPDMNLLQGSEIEGFVATKSRVESERSSLRQENSNNSRQTNNASRRQSRALYLNKLLGLRQYDMVKETVSNIDVSELGGFWISGHIPLLHTLARFGLFDVLKRVCTREVASKFDDHEWCNQAETAYHVHKNDIEPLLKVACNREIPNMAVIRFLVEDMSVNINATSRKRVFVDNGKQSEHVSGHSVLHDIAKGKTWWNVHEALPYLIRKGADLEVRNGSGDTPLHIAVEQKRYKGVFYKEAVKILLESGADANTVNYHGESCLSKAGTDTGLIKLLLSHGAKISSAAIFSAIGLHQGDFANLRRPTNGILEGIPPLYHAAFCRVQDNRVKDNDLIPSRTRMMTVLLRHGADPYATIGKLHRVSDGTFKGDIESEDGPESEWTSKTYTVIHEILHKGFVAEPLFDLPSLQMETRDSTGQTLLLAASRGRNMKQFQDLLARGADFTARDQEGRTIVHNLMKHEPEETTYECLKALFNQYPNLVHMPDKAGDTPLHYVLKSQEPHLSDYFDRESERGCRRDIDLLLEQGADPLQPDSNGNTALHFFALRPLRFKSRIEQFQSLGVDINARNKAGNSPIFEYIARGQLRAGGPYGYIHNRELENHDDVHYLRYFKQVGVDFFARDNAGSSLLHVLARRKLNSSRFVHFEEERTVPIKNLVNWFEFLTGIGLDPMLEDAQQRTCLDVASACGNEHILKLFQQKPVE